MKYKEDTVESNILFSNDNSDPDDYYNINKLRKIDLSDDSDDSNESDVNVEDIYNPRQYSLNSEESGELYHSIKNRFEHLKLDEKGGGTVTAIVN